MATDGKLCDYCGMPGHASLDCSGALLVLTSGGIPDVARPEEKAIVKARPKTARVRVYTELCEATPYHFDIGEPRAGEREDQFQARVAAAATAAGVPLSVFNPADGEMGYLADGAEWAASAQGGTVEFSEIWGAESFGVIMNHPSD